MRSRILAFQARFQIALLHGGQGVIDDHQADALGLDDAAQLLDLARAEQGRGARTGDGNEPALTHIELDGASKPDGFLKPRPREARHCAR